MARPTPLLITLAVAATVVAGTMAPAPAGAHPAAAKAHASSHHGKTPTKFAFSGDGYGSQVRGGSVPANSSQTAFSVLGCTNLAGLKRGNYVARATVPGLGVVHGVRTTLVTTKQGNTYSTVSTHSIARVVLAQSGLGTLEIDGLKSVARAYNQNGTYKTQTETDVASIAFTTGGKTQKFPIPTPGQPITIPGFATIAIGSSNVKKTSSYAQANANALHIAVLPLHTSAVLAQTRARISGGIKHGVFKGYGAGLQVSAADDNIRVGRNPLTPLLCEGTHGKPVTKSLAQVDGGDGLQADGVASGVIGTNNQDFASATARGQVADVSLANGAIEVGPVIGQVHVERLPGGRVTTSSAGTRVLSFTANGKEYALKKIQTINIPGLAKVQTGLTTKLNSGLKVIGLRVTLLDGTGAVVDLGIAKAQIRRGVS